MIPKKHVAHGGNNAYILVRKPKRQFVSPQHRWEDTITLDLKEGCEWIKMAQDRGLWQALEVMNLQVKKCSKLFCS